MTKMLEEKEEEREEEREEEKEDEEKEKEEEEGEEEEEEERNTCDKLEHFPHVISMTPTTKSEGFSIPIISAPIAISATATTLAIEDVPAKKPKQAAKPLANEDAPKVEPKKQTEAQAMAEKMRQSRAARSNEVAAPGSTCTTIISASVTTITDTTNAIIIATISITPIVTTPDPCITSLTTTLTATVIAAIMTSITNTTISVCSTTSTTLIATTDPCITSLTTTLTATFIATAMTSITNTTISVCSTTSTTLIDTIDPCIISLTTTITPTVIATAITNITNTTISISSTTTAIASTTTSTTCKDNGCSRNGISCDNSINSSSSDRSDSNTTITSSDGSDSSTTIATIATGSNGNSESSSIGNNVSKNSNSSTTTISTSTTSVTIDISNGSSESGSIGNNLSMNSNSGSTTTISISTTSPVYEKIKLGINEAIGEKFANIIVLETLGTGRFGEVKLGIDEATGEKVALKFLKIKDKYEIDRELMTLKNLKKVYHQNIIRMKYYVILQTEVIIVLEFAAGGDLFRYIQHSRFPEQMARSYFHQLIDGLSAMHSLNICHRDLKPQNLLLDSNFELKIADFGKSAAAADECNGNTRSGSGRYAAPETGVFESRKYYGKKYDGKKADIWSCGVTLFEMITGTPPYNIRKPSDSPYSNWWYWKLLEKKDRFWWAHDRNFSVPKLAKDLLTNLFNEDPACRPSIAQIKEHCWYKDTIMAKDALRKEMTIRDSVTKK